MRKKSPPQRRGRRQALPRAPDRWGNQCGEIPRLRARGFDVSPPTVIAQTGWRSDVLLAAITDEAAGPTPNLVTVLIGVNDQYQGRDVGGFRQNFRRVLDRAEGLAADGRDDLVVVTIPDYSVTPFVAGRDTGRIRRELADFNAAVAEEAAARGLPVVNITPGSRGAGAAPEVLLASDGLHPSARQYAQWVAQIAPVAAGVVRE